MGLQSAFHDLSGSITGSSEDISSKMSLLTEEIKNHQYIKAKIKMEELERQRETDPNDNNTYEVFERHYLYQRFWYILIWIGIIISMMLFVRLTMKNNI